MVFLKKIKHFIEKDLGLNYHDWLFLAGVLSVFVIFVSSSISKFALWADEAFSVYMTHFNFIEIAKLTALDVHSPLYYWTLKSWVCLFGDSESAVRSLSLLFGCLSIVAAYILVKFIYNRRAAYFSSIILLISPLFIRYSQETRMYTMMIFFAVLATLLLVIADRKKTNKFFWSAYGVVLGIGILTHYMFALVAISHLVWRYFDIRLFSKKEKFFNEGWNRAIFSGFITVVIWLPFALCQFFLIQSNGFWPSNFNIKDITDFISTTIFFISSEDMTVPVWICFFFVVLSVIYLIKKILLENDKSRRYTIMLACICFVPVLLLAVLSLPPFKPIFISRYLLCSSFFIYILIAVSISYFWRRNKSSFIVSGLVIFALMFGVYNIYSFTGINGADRQTTNMRDLIHDVKQSGYSAPIISNSYGIYYELNYYASDINEVFFVNKKSDESLGSYGPVRNNKNKIDSLNNVTTRFKHFWYVVPARNGDSSLDDVPRPKMNWIPEITIMKKDKNTNESGFSATLYRVMDL